MKRLIKAILIFLGVVIFWIGMTHFLNLHKDTFKLIANITLVGGAIIYFIWGIYILIGDKQIK